MNNPKVSIITATRNRPDLLKRCIVAIQQQDWDDYEHIIVGDHCKYAKKVFDEFKSDPHLRYGKTEGPHVENHGSVGKNKGIEMARGKYIGYCDDDNILFPNHTRTLYELLEEGHSDIVFTAFYYIDIPEGDNRSYNILKLDIDQSIHNTEEYFKNQLHGPVNYDMLVCGHKKDLYPTRLKWPTVEQVGPNEDGSLMSYLGVPNSILPGGYFPPMHDHVISALGLDPDPKINNIHIVPTPTALYVPAGHYNNDRIYTEKLRKLKDGLYVYPELVINPWANKEGDSNV